MTESNNWTPGKTVQAPIHSVLVLEDRAQVTRRCSLELEAGENTISVVPVTPLVADRTLRGRLLGEEPGARILEVQVRRHYQVRASRPEKEREVTESIQKLGDEYRANYDWALTGFHRLSLYRTYLNGLQRQINDRLLMGSFDERCPGEITQLFQARASMERELVRGLREQKDRRRRLDRLEDERRLALKPASDYSAAVVLQLKADVAGSYQLELQYQVACALWRPAYTAGLSADAGNQKVAWSSAGMVWQATGEDWPEVQLSFSTERPAQGAELPLLTDDLLSSREKTDREKQVIEVTSRDEAIEQVSDAPVWEAVSDTPPGLDDGGQVRTFRVPGRVTVPGDGRPHRIDFERWEAPAECQTMAVPERAPYAFLRSLQENPSKMPLLAGPVGLTRQGAYVGRSQIRYVSPAEKFALSWGSEDGLIVQRHQTQELEESKIRKRKHYHYHVEVYLSNHTQSPRTLEVCERLPVSEIEQVQVELSGKKTSSGFRRDDQGLLRCELTLPPGAEEKLTLAYTVSMPRNVHWRS